MMNRTQTLMVVPLYGLHIDFREIALTESAKIIGNNNAVQGILDDLLSAESSFSSFLRAHPSDSFLLIQPDAEIALDATSDVSRRWVEQLPHSLFPAIKFAEGLLEALRLFRNGRFTHGGFWTLCRSKLNEPVIRDGQSVDGFSLDLQVTPPGLTLASVSLRERGGYQLSGEDIDGFLAFEKKTRPAVERAKSRSNFSTALRFFFESYEERDEEFNLVFLVISLEALLCGPEQAQISDQRDDKKDQIRKRASSLLGEAAFYEEFNKFYKVRNNVMHGTTLTEKDRMAIREVDRLREFVRRILLGCLGLNSEPGSDYRGLIDSLGSKSETRSKKLASSFLDV